MSEVRTAASRVQRDDPALLTETVTASPSEPGDSEPDSRIRRCALLPETAERMVSFAARFPLAGEVMTNVTLFAVSTLPASSTDQNSRV